MKKKPTFVLSFSFFDITPILQLKSENEGHSIFKFKFSYYFLMCLQLERSSSSVRTKPNWKYNMKYGKRKAGYIFYLYRMCLKPPKSHPVLDVYS